MNRKLASTLTFAATTAALLAVAAIASVNAYADDITIDDTPFVSSRTRADVRAEAMGLSSASSEWTMQAGSSFQPDRSYTNRAARDEYIAARREVNALNAEDSGSSYLSMQPRRNPSTILAGEVR
jgi:hypothetical protein